MPSVTRSSSANASVYPRHKQRPSPNNRPSHCNHARHARHAANRRERLCSMRRQRKKRGTRCRRRQRSEPHALQETSHQHACKERSQKPPTPEGKERSHSHQQATHTPFNNLCMACGMSMPSISDKTVYRDATCLWGNLCMGQLNLLTCMGQLVYAASKLDDLAHCLS